MKIQTEQYNNNSHYDVNVFVGDAPETDKVGLEEMILPDILYTVCISSVCLIQTQLPLRQCLSLQN